MQFSAFHSGVYRTKIFRRHIGVCNGKECKRVFLRGLYHAVLDDNKITSVEVQLNGVPIKGFSYDQDRLILPYPLKDGNYYLYMTVTYSDLERPIYGRSY